MIEIYTDGGANPNPGEGGLGILLLHEQHRLEIWEYYDHATNNFLELTAILHALQAIKKKNIPTIVYSDSEYAICVVTGIKYARANRDLVDEIKYEISQFTDIKFSKVLAHSGNINNEFVDHLCHLARDTKSGGKKRY